MEKLKEVELVLERTDDLRNIANILSKNESISYDEAFNKAKNLNGVDNISEIANINNYGEPTYVYKETLMNIGGTVNGIDVSTIAPEKLEAILTSKNVTGEIPEFKKEMSVDDIRINTVNMRLVKEKTKEKDKVLILEKPENRKGVNA